MCILKGFFLSLRNAAKLQKYFINSNRFPKILLREYFSSILTEKYPGRSLFIIIFCRMAREEAGKELIAYQT